MHTRTHTHTHTHKAHTFLIDMLSTPNQLQDTHGRSFVEDTNSARWSQLISSTFLRRSNVTVSVNTLRSSFVTHLLSEERLDGLDERMKEQFADAMRHSTTHVSRHTPQYKYTCIEHVCLSVQQKRTYDRRTTNERVGKAVDLMGRVTATQLQEDSFSPEESHGDDSNDETTGVAASSSSSSSSPPSHHRHSLPYREGDIVAVVDEHSTRKKPVFILGKVLQLLKRRQALLAHLAPQQGEEEEGATRFKLRVGSTTWLESLDAVVFPVDVEFDNRDRLYRLRTSPLEIHESLEEGRQQQAKRRKR